MNGSNRYGIETMAREQQADIKRHLHLQVLLRGKDATPRLRGQRSRWIVRLVSASVVGLIASLVASFLH